MNRRCVSACGFALFLAVARVAAAQGTSPDLPRTLHTMKLENLTEASGATTVNPTSSFSVTGSAAEKSASAQLSLQAKNTTLTFGLKAPLNQSQGRAVLADLDGLRNKAAATLGLLWSHWIQPEPTKMFLSPVSPQQLRHPETAEARAITARIIRQLRKTAKPMYLAGVTASIGPETFRYVTSPDLSGRTESHQNWSVTATAGVVTTSGLLVTGKYTHQSTYDGQDPTQICTPLGSAGALECSDKVVGAPSHSQSEQVGVEVRKFFSDVFAISPRLTRDIRNGVTGVDVPLYFIRNDKGGLTGGLAVGWRSDRRGEVTLSAFVGQVLGLILK